MRSHRCRADPLFQPEEEILGVGSGTWAVFLRLMKIRRRHVQRDHHHIWGLDQRFHENEFKITGF